MIAPDSYLDHPITQPDRLATIVAYRHALVRIGT
jgi:hypothetical protein